MFRFFINPLGMPLQDLSDLHPVILEALLERSWNQQVNSPTEVAGHPDNRSDVPGRPDQLLDPVLGSQVARASRRARPSSTCRCSTAKFAVSSPAVRSRRRRSAGTT